MQSKSFENILDKNKLQREIENFNRPNNKQSAEEPRFAQLIRGKLRFCINVFQWQFNDSTHCALRTRSQFPSPHRNHSGDTFLLLLILRPWDWE